MRFSRGWPVLAAMSAAMWFLPGPANAVTRADGDVATSVASTATCDGRSATLVVTAHSPHTVYGTGHRDVIVVRDAGHVVHARGGNDLVCGSTGDDDLFGGYGDDHLYGGAGLDHLYGGHGDDHLYGGPGEDWCDGGTGHDDLHGDEHHDSGHMDG